ncbi:MAG: hypothetical protein ACRESZ_15095 [Methylococcales bacterium]
MVQTLETEISEQLHRLSDKQQRQVLEFARSLVALQIRGVPGKNLLYLAGTIESDDLSAMSRAIDEGCEQVSVNEWEGTARSLSDLGNQEVRGKSRTDFRSFEANSCSI